MNEEILAKTLEQFYHSVKLNADEIEKFLLNEDYKNHTIKVYVLKISARLIEAEVLSEKVHYLVEYGNALTDENINNIKLHTPKQCIYNYS